MSKKSAALNRRHDMVAAHMAKLGLRSTGPRRLIIETFLGAREHVTIEGLLAAVRKRSPRVGYVTVYRTLKVLADHGAAIEHQFGDGLTRYEAASAAPHHDHLICLECRSITEFEAPEIEALQAKVAAQHGFEVRSHKHELYGVCDRCRAKDPKRRQ